MWVLTGPSLSVVADTEGVSVRLYRLMSGVTVQESREQGSKPNISIWTLWNLESIFY